MVNGVARALWCASSCRRLSKARPSFVAARTTLSGIGFAREYAYIEPTPMRRMIAES
jgi:hypothetical protein